MSKRINIIFFVLCITVLIVLKMDKYNIITLPNPNLPDWLLLLLTFLIGSGTLIWGISGVNNHRKRRPKKSKTIIRKFISIDFTSPDLTLSYGQIIGGIMGIIYVILMIADGIK